ncbi:MAG: hypothetical protein D6B25_01215 [Desulfobulbaceae bacterium]|nr:MAG: hypothetical protein D6B25_01215 [Desulfobulbaceae bacterium]
MNTQSFKRADPGKMFSKIDTDGDGGISQAELDAVANKVVQRTGYSPDVANAVDTHDLDGDSKLSQEEMKNMMMERLQQMVPPSTSTTGVSPHLATLAYQTNTDDTLTGTLLDLIDTYATNLSVENSDHPLLRS